MWAKDGMFLGRPDIQVKPFALTTWTLIFLSAMASILSVQYVNSGCSLLCLKLTPASSVLGYGSIHAATAACCLLLLLLAAAAAYINMESLPNTHYF